MKRGTVPVICAICGGTFYISPYRLETAKFCSRRCLGSHNSKIMAGNKRSSGQKPNQKAYKKGHAPWNKGMKGIILSPGTLFKKGEPSSKRLPVGTVRIRGADSKTPRAWIKVAEPNKWKPRSVYVWESLHGKVPKGYLIHHKNENTLDDSPSNLKCLTRSRHLALHNRLRASKRRSA